MKISLDKKATKKFKREIDGYLNNATYNSSNKNYDWTYNTATSNSIQIANAQGSTLPSTGGMGTKLFYIIGAILVAGAAIILVARRRTNRD